MNIFGDKSLDDINTKIDNLTTSLNKNQTAEQDQNSDQLSGELLSSFYDNNSNEMNSIFNNIAIPQDRLSRYNIYDEMFHSVPLVKRMISVYISNIMSKNPLTSKSFIYKDLKNTSDKVKIEKSKKLCSTIVDQFKLEEKLKNIILPNKLTYGDFFVEILNIKKRTENLNFKNNGILLTEFVESIPKVSTKNIDYYLREASEYLVAVDDSVPEISIMETEVPDEDDENEGPDEVIKIDDILLRYHKPHNIIILNTKYGTCVGYLEVLTNNSSTMNINSMVQKITNMSFTGESQSEKIIDKLVYFITKKIFTTSNKDAALVDSLDEESLKLIKRFFIEQDLDLKNKHKYKKLNVRFISVSDMVHFKSHGSVEYSPFSRSVIDPLVFVGKLYMLTQLANAISKLSRSAAIRKWTIDTGSSRMTGQMVNRLKRELYNTRVTINDLGSFKSMANILSDFKDMFVIQQNDRTPVNVDIQQMGDPTIKVQDLQDLRQELISLSGIPAVYLGYQDSVELREQLMHVNVSFATEIIDMQENDINCINSIISKIAISSDAININPTKHIQISLLPPIILMVQLIESTLGSVGNIVTTFQNMDIPTDPFYFLEQYIQQIDWVKFKESALIYQAEITAKKSASGSSQGY